jgi:predicted MPP superfamily phosphohydrolase
VSEPMHFSGTMARAIRFFRAHYRVITCVLVAALAVWRTPSDAPWWGPVFFFAMFGVLIASQVFWIGLIRELGRSLIQSKSWRRGLGAAGLIVYFSLLANDLFTTEFKGSGLTLRAVLLEAPFKLWLLGSSLGFLVAMFLWIFYRIVRAISWPFKKFINPPTQELQSPDRRRFLGQSAIALSATPFIAGTYGLFYGRLNLETTHQRIKLQRLPKAFEGFRIVQLSDLHISPFMSAEEIRRYVAIANQLKGDLVVLTGDFLTYDPSAQRAVVQALSALKAPYGVFGCLGNHEYMTETEESITRLFATAQIRILRQERVAVQSHDGTLNLIGIDYQQARFSRDHDGHLVDRYMEGSEKLVMPGTANILLNHNPNAFDRAAELSIDLMLTGHTHGGQLSLESVHRGLCFSRLATPYVRGWYEKAGSQLYVNRGIGTIGFPIRVGAPPEISALELVRDS